MEMYLTQNIMKQGDFKFHKMPGYVQHFQVDPFGVHMHFETGISIVVQYLRRKTPLTLHLDATGNVASKVPVQMKRLLYYSFTLPRGGQNAPPLPVCKMLTNKHSVPPITFWPMQFLQKISQYTKLRVHQVETDYSIGRKTADKGLKDFATFARLQNTTSMTTALKIFHSLCTVLIGKHNTSNVLTNLKDIQDLVREHKIPDMEKTENLQDSPLAQEDDVEE